ncbi:MAG: NAD-dependent epimerase/dehydratase family protein [Telmatospirillum sp.]|nr:NAD-dependent epimerase/dehydratase family protein [Telmatospirillum sp.]
MAVAIVTGSAGLIGSETVRFFSDKGFDVVGIDNDMRRYFFGDQASTQPNREILQREIGAYRHETVDIRDADGITKIFATYGPDIAVVVHTAAQPSHDWAAREPFTDFGVNAQGTLHLLEATRQYCPEAVFLFTSTNKVYGDAPNHLPLVEGQLRYELASDHRWAEFGVDETMSIDQSMHSIFGASKVAADVMVQEYGRYFGMKTAVFRGGCLTGPGHAGAPLHGFLAYLVKCAVSGEPYTVLGYKGKQVRDNIHSHDLVSAFWEVFLAPRNGEVYNAGGGRRSNCSMLEAITALERLTGRSMNWQYKAENRQGDHIWWISDTRKLAAHYPTWRQRYGIEQILEEMVEAARRRQFISA